MLQGLLQELGSFALNAPTELQISALKIITLLSQIPESYIADSQTARLLSLIWQEVLPHPKHGHRGSWLCSTQPVLKPLFITDVLLVV